MGRPDRLPWLLTLIYLLNVPRLLWMWTATGGSRLLAASLWAFVHFMNQPIYNSMLPEFLPTDRRSAGFGFSNMLGFGCGAIGPLIMPWFDNTTGNYTAGFAALAGIGFLASLLPLFLALRTRRPQPS